MIIENGKKQVRIRQREDGTYLISFYYDNLPDYEWKRGAHGMFCDITDTLAKAKSKAKRYIGG